VSDIPPVFSNSKRGEKQLHIRVVTEVKHSGRLSFAILQFATTQFITAGN
jgi:hypothetical protein